MEGEPQDGDQVCDHFSTHKFSDINSCFAAAAIGTECSGWMEGKGSNKDIWRKERVCGLRCALLCGSETL